MGAVASLGPYGCKSKKIAHHSHNYPKKFGWLENNAYFCRIKYQKSEDK